MDLSIIILSSNTAQVTYKTLESTMQAVARSQKLQVEILVLDNASTDGSDEMLVAFARENPCVQVFLNTENVGFGRGNNQLLAHARGEYILFLNSDMLLDSIDLADMVGYLRQHPKVGALSPFVQLRSGVIDPASHRGFPTLWRSFCYFSGLEKIFTSSPQASRVMRRIFGGYHLRQHDYATEHQIEACTGACLCMPRQLANELGGFDTAYFMYGEDLDLCLRIQNAGFIVWWYPKQRVTHLKYSSGLGSNQKSIKLRIRWHFYDAMERFYRTHYERYYGFFISTLVYLVLAIQKRRVNPQMKVVALDGRLLYQTGVGVYIRNILYHLTAFSSEDIAYRIYARSSDIPRMQKELISMSSVRYSQYMFCVADEKWHGFAEQITFLAKLYSGCYHLVHFTYFSWPIGYFGRFVATVHDTTPLEYTSGRLSIRHPMIYKIKRWVLGHVFRLQLQRALMIVVPSEAVKRALRRYTRRTDICVLSEGISADLLGAVSEPVRDLCPGRYILRAGNCYPHKNVEGFLSACANEKLVLVGPNDEFTSMLKRKHPQVTWLHNISPGQLRWLYENALCSVMPSFTEGFGLPVLESLHFHCPVACSNIPVFREIAGEYGYYFDPHDRDSIRNAVQKAKRAPHIALDLSGFNFATMTSGLVQIYRSHL